LDKRFYIPTIKNLKFFSLKGEDLDVYADSIFFKKLIFNFKESELVKKNLFFYDKIRYDNNAFSFLNYQVAPTKNIIDLYSLKNKPRVYSIKPFFMSFKLFSENQFDGFEKFYLEKKLFVADSFDILLLMMKILIFI
jgi:hypothetical protein